LLLQDLLSKEFVLFFNDAQPTLIIQSTDQTIDPKERSLEVSKKCFFDAVMEIVERDGPESLADHPATFFQDFSYDVYRKQKRSKATKLLEEWGKIKDAN